MLSPLGDDGVSQRYFQAALILSFLKLLSNIKRKSACGSKKEAVRCRSKLEIQPRAGTWRRSSPSSLIVASCWSSPCSTRRRRGGPQVMASAGSYLAEVGHTGLPFLAVVGIVGDSAWGRLLPNTVRREWSNPQAPPGVSRRVQFSGALPAGDAALYNRRDPVRILYFFHPVRHLHPTSMGEPG